MRKQATNTQASNEKNLSEEEIVESLRSSTTCAYMFSPNHGDIDTSNLINIVKNDDKTILRHTVNIAGIPTDTSIRFEINHGKGGRPQALRKHRKRNRGLLFRAPSLAQRHLALKNSTGPRWRQCP